MVTGDHEDEEHDPVRERAREAIAGADATLAEPRPYAGAGEQWARSAGLVTKFAEPHGTVRKVRLQEPESPPVSAKLVKWPELTDICRTTADTINRIVGDTQAAFDRRDVRIRDLEARLAAIEGRVTGVEAKASKRK